MSNNEKLVDLAEVGKKGDLSEKHTICAVFHDFEELPHQVGDETVSPHLSCHGYSWQISVYPGGDEQQLNNDEKYVSLFLRAILSENKSSLQAIYTLRSHSRIVKAKSKFTNNQTCYGLTEFLFREDVLDRSKGFLESDGSLRVFVDIQVYRTKLPTWTPKKTLHLDMQRLLESKKGADVVFDIDGTTFSAHSNILSQRAPALAELAEGSDSSDVPLSGVDPDMFKVLLQFIYTDEISSDIDFKSMLELANRFGCSRLKLLAESKMIEKGINVGNAADLLLFADSHSCALLREEALECISANPEMVMESNGWRTVEESLELMSEVMRACFLKKKTVSAISGMSVAELRQKLDEKGLDVDGTRKMLIDRLKQAEASTG